MNESVEYLKLDVLLIIVIKKSGQFLITHCYYHFMA